jgi:hypothetical protein
MRIFCLTSFKDGTRLFENGDVCTLTDIDGQRFIDNGWAAVEGEEVKAAPGAPTVDLNVHGSFLGVVDSKVS